MTINDTLTTEPESRRFRPSSRRRTRIALGAALAAVAIGGNVVVYSQLDQRTEVLQVVANVPAGQEVTADMVRVVAVDVDPAVPVVQADQLALIDHHYAKTHILAGTLLAPQLVQAKPLIGAGQSVVALELRPTQVPNGARERSQVRIVIRANDETPSQTIVGHIVWIGETDSIGGVIPVSVEVADINADVLAMAESVGLILVDPGADPAMEESN